MYHIIIVGAGTAGLSAAIYGVRAGKSVLVMEGEAYGGQIINTLEIENYPGIKHVSGFDFAQGLYEQATALGAEYKASAVKSIDDMGDYKVVHTRKQDIEGKTVILATGAKNRKLGLPREDELSGAGVSYCATCDGAFFRGKDVVIAGGGNTAIEDAIYMSNVANKVYVVHRREQFRAEQALVDSLKEKDNVEFVLNANVVNLHGEQRLDGVEVEDKNTKERRILPVSGIFVAIGQVPQNEPFENLVVLEGGYIKAGEDTLTSAKNVFAAGDCRTKTVRQLTTAAADGATAAIAAIAALDYGA